MKRWLIALLVLAASPLAAEQEGDNPAPAEGPEAEQPADEGSIADTEVGGAADGVYLPLTLGRDRTGIGMRARASVGYDDNLFKVDRDEDTGAFVDGLADLYAGMNLGLFAFGTRATLAGRLHFGDPDANLWDLKLGGFFKLPYGGGGLGCGLSADVLYQQLQTYEILGPITRRDDLRAAGAVARAHIGYSVSFVVFELGLHGRTQDFSEELSLDSLDSWAIGADFSIGLNFWDVLEIKPYARFDYEWFRDQFDLMDDGSYSHLDDRVQLMDVDVGADWTLDVGLIEATGRVYIQRQDDSAHGHDRYWQYGLRAAADFNFVDELRITAGLHAWNREFDDRLDLEAFYRINGGGSVTVFERYVQFWTELSWNFWAFMHAGARYSYTRRTSDIDNGGYANNQITAFLEIGF
ncbi:MAG: hypothetical protein IT463_05790 [Planctomycetes bacterium]|nr:hypothetical protein [Planctomycetota bacterium]